MKTITRLSLALMMFALFSVSYLVTTVAADPRGNAGLQNKWGTPSQDAPQGNYNAPKNRTPGLTTGQNRQGGKQHYNGNLSNTRGYQPQGSPQTPRMAAPDAAGSSYNLNQPVNQGGVNGVIAESSQENNHGCTSSERWEPAGPYCVPK